VTAIAKAISNVIPSHYGDSALNQLAVLGHALRVLCTVIVILHCRGRSFFTVNLAERQLRLLMEHIDELRSTFRKTRRRHPFAIDSIRIGRIRRSVVW
jgi:hypothetical protein